MSKKKNVKNYSSEDELIDIGKAGGVSSDFEDTYDIGYDEYEERYKDFSKKRNRKGKLY